jgi:hypothetical protein
MTNGETFTSKIGTRYQVSQVSTWELISGKMVTTGRVDNFNPQINHGGSISMNSLEWAALKERG